MKRISWHTNLFGDVAVAEVAIFKIQTMSKVTEEATLKSGLA
jgi:hypothetical protein